MKKLLFFVLILVLNLHNFPAKGQSSLRFSVGYGLPLGSNLLATEDNYSSNTYTSKAVNGSFGSGVYVSASYQRMFSSYLGLDLGVSYLSGTKYTSTSNSSFGTTSGNSTGTAQSTAFLFSPMLVIQPATGNWKPYIKAGISTGIIKLTSQESQSSTPVFSGSALSRTTEYTGGLPFGFRGGVGFLANTDSHISFFAEILFTSMTHYPSQASTTAYSVDGVDKLGTLTESQKTTLFKSEITQTSAPADPTKPSETLGSSFPMGSVMLNVGIEMKLGKAKSEK